MSKLHELKLDWLLLSRQYSNMFNVEFDKWICGIAIDNEVFFQYILPLLTNISEGNSRCPKDLLQQTLEEMGLC